MPTKKAIIVDDSFLFRLNTKNLISQRLNLEVLEASTLKEMFNHFMNVPVEDIALVILDINLPDGNGLNAMRSYKEKYPGDNLPFIVVSTGISRDILPLAMKYGARDVLVKPLNLEELIDRIEPIMLEKLSEKSPSRARAREKRKYVKDLYEPIRMEIKRAQRGKYSFSIFMLRAQPMGKDGLSLTQGEEDYQSTPSKMSRRIKAILRETDNVVELTEKEVLLLLPFTDSEGVSIVNKKIQELFSREEDYNRSKLIIFSVSFPEHGEKTDELIVKLESGFKEQFSEWEKSNT